MIWKNEDENPSKMFSFNFFFYRKNTFLTLQGWKNYSNTIVLAKMRRPGNAGSGLGSGS
jgi:hypothetical protein